MKTLKILAASYLAVSILTLVAVVLLRHHPSIVTDAVWVRTSIVAVSTALTFTFAVRAAGGSRGAYRRLRILSLVMLVAIGVIIALPGTFPVWLKVEQGLCGVLLLGVVIVANRRPTRALFTDAGETGGALFSGPGETRR
jgi:hypothetical protein